MQTLRSITALIIREMSTTYGKSAGGYAWALIEPLAAITLLSIIFSLAFRAPALGNNFPLFYATGFFAFTFYSDLQNKVAASIRFSKALLFYPAVNYFDAIIARLVLNTITQTLVFILLIASIFYYFELRQTIELKPIVNSIFMASSLGLGVGTLNCFLTTKFPIWDRFWNIFSRPMFILSGVFFIYEGVPSPFRDYLWYNPVMHISGEMRSGFYATYDANYVSPIYVYSISFTCLLIGLIFLGRYQRELMNR